MALETLPQTQSAIDAMTAANSAQAAEAARSKLAQEHLLANPAEMRQLFPRVLGDVSVNHNGHIDMYEIEQGLKNPNLAQCEKDLLQTFRQGYEHMRFRADFGKDSDGISADSLAMIDKAVNRSITDDPHFSSTNFSKPLIWATSGAIGGLITNRALNGKNSKVGLAAVAAWVLTGLAIGEGKVLWEKYGGAEDEKYDGLKNEYQLFVADLKNNQKLR